MVKRACMEKGGGICDEGGMHGKGGHAWDMTRYGE